MRCGVVMFPGSNCDHDVYHVLKHVLGQETRFLWHQDTTLRGVDLVVLPGAFPTVTTCGAARWRRCPR